MWEVDSKMIGVGLVWIHKYIFSLISEIKRKRRQALFLPWMKALGSVLSACYHLGRKCSYLQCHGWRWRYSRCRSQDQWLDRRLLRKRGSTAPRAINMSPSSIRPFSWFDYSRTLKWRGHMNKLKVHSIFTLFGEDPASQLEPAESSSTVQTFHWAATSILECFLWKQLS